MTRAALVVSAIVAHSFVSAPKPSYADNVERLAKVCSSEIGFDTEAEDCPAIHAVIQSRAERRGITWARAARAYSGRVFDRRRTDSRRWIPWLRPDLRKPRYWPRSASWQRFGRPGWAHRLEESRRIWAGELRPPCEPEHWGGPVVDRARIRRGIRRGYWREVDCGATRNTFLKLL